MPKNINSAYRIREILNDVKEKQDKVPTHEVWADVFRIDEPDQHKKNFAISRCLADLHDEVELIRSEMHRLNYSENLYGSSLNVCNTVFAVQSIMASWQILRQQITTDVPIVLGFCSEILPNEEELIDEEDIIEIKKMASRLEANLCESSLPIYTRQLIEKHLAKIQEALDKYKVVGSKALDEVMQAAYGEVIVNEAVFKEAKGSEELGRLSTIWQKTKTVLDGVADINSRLGAMQGMAEKGQKIIELLENLNA